MIKRRCRWLASRCRHLVALLSLAAFTACHDSGGEVARVSHGLCDLPVSSWLVLGPLPLDTGALRLDRWDIGDPALVSPEAGDVPVGSPGLRWHGVSSDSLGRVDLYNVFPGASLDDRAAYAITYIASPEPRTVRIAVESDDAVVVWINGRRVLRNDAARELRSGADTITIPLAAGVNRLLYRVVNRGGDFGLGARLLNGSPDPTGDLYTGASESAVKAVAAATWGPGGAAGSGGASDSRNTSASHPARIALGPAVMESRARIENGVGDSSSALIAPVRVCVTRRVRDLGEISLVAGSDTELVPEAEVGEPAIVTLHARWAELARAVLAGQSNVTARIGDTAVASLRLPATSGALLTLLSRPMGIDVWRGTRGGDGGVRAWLASLRGSVRLTDSTDSTTRERIARLDAPLHVPSVLGGLTLDAYVAEFGRGASFAVDGRRVTPDSLGMVTLCAGCRAGAPLSVSIAKVSPPWWDAPLVRVREPGWREVHDGAIWARYFTGDQTLALPDSDVARELLRAALDPAKKEYLAAIDDWTRRLAPASARVRRDTIDLVGHSHIDAAWMWRWREGREVVDATWATVTKLMTKYPDMHFAASSAQYYAWLEKYDPELLGRIQALVREGRWDPVGGWWVESDANIPSGESLVRQALYGQRTYMRLFGKTSRVAWLPNTFGFAWSLPQILRKSGFQFFVTEEMRWNDTDAWPAKLNAFWWEGPDGSRIFTDMIYSYDHDLSPRRLAKEFTVTRDSSASRRMLTVYGVGDHGGGPTMAMLDRARNLQRMPGFPVVRDASPDSSLSRMRLDARDGPVFRDELYLEYHRGVYTTQAEIKKRNRELEALLVAAEAAAAIAPVPYPHDSLRVAWERVLFNQFHDILPGTAIDSVYRDAESDYVRAESIARRALDRALVAIAGSLDTRPTSAGGVPYLVFNSSGHTRTDVVRIPAGAGAQARDGEGRVLPSVIRDSVLEVLVSDVPALGASVIFVRSGEPASPIAGAMQIAAGGAPHGSAGAVSASSEARDVGPGPPTDSSGGPVLENDAMRVEIDPATGSIARLYDKLHGVSALKPGAGGLVLIEDRPLLWDAWNIDNLNGKRAWVDQNVRIGPVERTPLGQSIAVTRGRDSTQVVQRYELRTGSDRLDIHFTIGWHESHRLLKLAVPLGFHIDSTRAEIPYASISRPTRPRTRRDSARFETPMQRWVDGSERAYGVAVVNDSKYGYSSSGDTIFVTLLRSPKSPDPHADMGTHAFDVSIVPHAGDWRAPEIRRAAASLNQPFIVAPVPVHAGERRSAGWITIEPSSIELGAFKRAEDDDRYIVRLVETDGRRVVARLTFGTPMSANEVDLLERPVAGGFHACGRTIDVPLGAFGIGTLTLQPETAEDAASANCR
ncbi:MAG TPA: glycoside hydrolase family 38 C-terminal domain-containing protein [Gemmatimonadaceae bacterium]|nr:glycoside hydrolase family 38 C-terminal domain-containing protein [Gemmatimonadaceae bacterium]